VVVAAPAGHLGGGQQVVGQLGAELQAEPGVDVARRPVDGRGQRRLAVVPGQAHHMGAGSGQPQGAEAAELQVWQ